MDGPFLAVDWGTTHVRAWRLDAGGAVAASRTFPLGVSRLGPGESAARFQGEIRPALGAEHLPAILCGMIGSNLGWTQVPYVDCPVGLAELGQALTAATGDPLAWIAPGLRGPGIAGAPDVMRGEETQVLGWLSRVESRNRGEHVLCLPGTHSKWVLVRDGRIVRFVTAMTGELFDVLTRHSVLRSETPADDLDAFHKGVEAAGDGGGLSARLFGARSRGVGAGAPAAETASYLSGLLIGSEVMGVAPLLEAGAAHPIALIGEPKLCNWYLKAFKLLGWTASADDGADAVLAGLYAINVMRTRP